ncbi:ABC transporter substrate-binding protein [Acidimangrovimonas sediminis]|uniref:ABC transporter substrate-binding protein n=1 Tax=Acidimangrovimonas sediminis TaxID=2056283 RepID=UPI000C7FB851|nr:extracellular solute-binding protein [Acidimangrovimonas sediminis]
MTDKTSRFQPIMGRRGFNRLLLGSAAGLAAPALIGRGAMAATDLSAYTSADIDWKQFKGTTLQLSGATHPWSSAIQPLLPQFTELTGIEVRADFQSEAEFLTSLPIRLGSGAAVPDVFMFLSYGQGIGAGWLEPLNAHYKDTGLTDTKWYDEEDLLGAAAGFPVWSNGERYAFPITTEAQIMFYSTEALHASGKPVPKTFEELYDTAVALKSNSEAGIAMRAKAASSATAASMGFLFSYGGRMVDDKGKVAFQSEEGIKALDMYGKMLRDAGPLGVGSYDWYEVLNDFTQGAAAIATDSSNFATTIGDRKKSRLAGKTTFSSLVSDGVHPSTPYMSCWQACINSKSRNKKAAFLFMLWATSKPTAALTSAAGLATTRSSAWKSDAFRKAFGAEAAGAALHSLSTADVTRSKEILFHPQAPMIFDAFAVATNEIVTSGTSAKDALTRAADRANRSIR